MRPRTLSEVAIRAAGDHAWDGHLREFLDSFYAADGDHEKQSTMIQDQPGLLGLPQADAFIGAAGEHLARRWGLSIPKWVRHPGRYLDVPLFVPGDLPSRPMLLISSPISFRSRLIFTGPDPLQRARFPYHRGTVAFARTWPRIDA